MLIKIIVLSVSTITFFSIVSSTAFKAAASLGGFVSVDDSKAKNVEQRRSIGSGTRSECSKTLPENAVTLLVPNTEVAHRTAQAKPSLYIQAKVATQTPLNFTLVDPQVSKPVVESSITVLEPGIKKIELPKQTRLKQGNIYLWYVAVPCSEIAQYQDILTSSVEFVPASPQVLERVKRSHDTSKIANVYAENGYWYDALDASINSKSASKSISLERLLKSVNLAPY
jgi:hypothetical protein